MRDIWQWLGLRRGVVPPPPKEPSVMNARPFAYVHMVGQQVRDDFGQKFSISVPCGKPIRVNLAPSDEKIWCPQCREAFPLDDFKTVLL